MSTNGFFCCERRPRVSLSISLSRGGGGLELDTAVKDHHVLQAAARGVVPPLAAPTTAPPLNAHTRSSSRPSLPDRPGCADRHPGAAEQHPGDTGTVRRPLLCQPLLLSAPFTQHTIPSTPPQSTGKSWRSPAAHAPPRVLLQAPGLGRAPRALLLRTATHRTRQAAVREAAAAAPFVSAACRGNF